MEQHDNFLTMETLPTVSWSEAPRNLSLLYAKRDDVVRRRFGSDDQFKETVNPDTQIYFGTHPRVAIMGDYPTILDIERVYGQGFATEWLLPHIARLSTFVGAKNIDVHQERELAAIVANEYRYLKITEILLFFYRFKTGRYGRFFGKVDPMIITCSLRDFIKERNEEIYQYEHE